MSALLRLQELLLERMDVPFSWGRQDCCLWAADAVLVQTSVDHAAPWRGTYSDARGAARLVIELGGLAAIGARAGEEIPPMAAAPGDIGLLDRGDRELLAVCIGQDWMLAGTSGLVPAPLADASRAWRVQRG